MKKSIIWLKIPKQKAAAVVLLFFLGALFFYPKQKETTVAVTDTSSLYAAEDGWLFLPAWREILLRGVPGAAVRYGLGGNIAEEAERWTRELVAVCTGIDAQHLPSLVSVQFPYPRSVAVSAKPKAEPKPALKLSGDPKDILVGIYHTHTAESFVPSSGAAHVPGGKTGEIAEVGAFLADCLEKEGVHAVQTSTVHDYPNFMQAYGASEVTAAQMVKDYPSLTMLLDIHRDASPRAGAVAEVNGETAAKLLLIVAQAQAVLEHPYWQENLRLAKAIEAKLNERYPGLSKGVQLTEWRYNQHLHPHALLIEVGSHETSKGEAMRSMKMLSTVLAELIRG